jgi:hypothetical protein
VTTKFHQKTKPLGRENVRVAGLMRSLEAFNEEVGKKTALSMAEYDRKRIEPLVRRLVWLEKPLVARAWVRCGEAWERLVSGRTWARLKVKFAKLPPPVS